MCTVRPLAISLRLGLLTVAAVIWLALGQSSSLAQSFRLVDGRVISGSIAMTTGVADNPERPSNQAGEIATKPIAIIDDELRRVYVAKRRIAEPLETAPDRLVTIKPWQNPSNGPPAWR
jgi:hypothetical protein